MGPDIGALVGDVDRDVADQADPEDPAVVAKPGPLPRELVLAELVVADLVRQLLARPRERTRIAAAEFRRPLRPGNRAVPRLQRAPESVVGQPRRVVGTERLEPGQVLVAALAKELARRLAQARLAEATHLLETDLPVGARQIDAEISPAQEPVLAQTARG